jgi:hypothetical protein
MSAQTNSGASALDIAYQRFDRTYEDYLAGEAGPQDVIERERDLQDISKFE